MEQNWLISDLSNGRACNGIAFPKRTTVPIGVESTWNSSINRLLPASPIPMPVAEMYAPSRAASRSYAGPYIDNLHPQKLRPGMKICRKIESSTPGVLKRVPHNFGSRNSGHNARWSCWLKLNKMASCRALRRAATTSCSCLILTDRIKVRFKLSAIEFIPGRVLARPRKHHPGCVTRHDTTPLQLQKDACREVPDNFPVFQLVASPSECMMIRASVGK